MLIEECHGMDEVFTHIDPDTGTVRHFNATKMNQAVPELIRKGGVRCIVVAMDPEFVEHVKNSRGVEQWKIDRLTEPYLSLPVLGVEMHDDTVLTVDGHHRLVALHAAKAEVYDMYLFTYAAALPFQVTDMPKGLEDEMVSVAKEQEGDHPNCSSAYIKSIN